MSQDHPTFKFSYAQNQKIWRYMNFTQFVSLLLNKNLWFNRIDKFEDSYEGCYPIETLKRFINLSGLPEVIEKLDRNEVKFKEMGLVKMTDQLKAYTYINCWYISDHESAAMWDIYTKFGEGIAIQTTYSLLDAAMPDNCFIGQVNYGDYNSDSLPIKSTGFTLFDACMLKRIAYEHEKELRVLIMDERYREEDFLTNYKDNNKLGCYIPCNPTSFIESIYISPKSKNWFKDLVKKISLDNGFANNVIFTSSMDTAPY